MKSTIILASASPRRQQLLEQAKIPFEVLTPCVDETFLEHLTIEDGVKEVALRKAKAVQALVEKERLILAADTIVVLEGRVLGKPKDRQEAIDFLTRIQNNSHQVITGVALLQDDCPQVFTEQTEVVFHALSTQQIEFYVDTYQPFDKAGAYAIQEWIGLVGIRAIHGDFYNVMGLPVSRILQKLSNLQ